MGHKPTTEDGLALVRLEARSRWNGECKIWTGCREKAGYGKIGYKDKTIRTHRLAWILTYGEIPDGLWVLHHCDNRACVRPNHLFLGTIQDNITDMCNKGRQASGDRNGTHTHPERVARGDRNGMRTHPEKRCKGELQGSSKLTEEKVLRIRARYSLGGISQLELAVEYGVVRSNISNIINHKRWAHI